MSTEYRQQRFPVAVLRTAQKEAKLSGCIRTDLMVEIMEKGLKKRQKKRMRLSDTKENASTFRAEGTE